MHWLPDSRQGTLARRWGDNMELLGEKLDGRCYFCVEELRPCSKYQRVQLPNNTPESGRLAAPMIFYFCSDALLEQTLGCISTQIINLPLIPLSEIRFTAHIFLKKVATSVFVLQLSRLHTASNAEENIRSSQIKRSNYINVYISRL